MNAQTILLVEDEESLALTERKALEEYGYRALVACSGEEAIEIAGDTSTEIDIILMDVDLGPGIDGSDAAREILSRRRLPIVFLSSRSEQGRVPTARDVPSYGYVIKDSGLPAMNIAIEMALERFKEEERLRDREARARKTLEAVMHPDGDIGALSLSEVVDIDTLRTLMEDFSSLTGMVVAILDIAGNILLATGWQEICTAFHRSAPASAAACTESDLYLAGNVRAGEYVEYKCKNGLWDIVTPLVIEGKHLGNIYTGQYFYDDDIVDESSFSAQAARYGYDQEAYLSALRKVPRFSRGTISRLMDYLVRLTSFVSRLSISNLRLAKTTAELRKTEELLSRSVREKETLLKELQHRVKNSLSIVSSLLSLNLDNVRDEDSRLAFREAADRISCVSAMYERLSHSESGEAVDLGRYLSDLVGLLTTTYARDDGRGPAVSASFDPMTCDPKRAVSLGLILNELFTNAIKHAGGGGRRGNITIRLRDDGERTSLSVDDDGPGFPPGFRPEDVKSLGLRIVLLLAEELEGELRFSGSAGTGARATLSFERR